MKPLTSAGAADYEVHDNFDKTAEVYGVHWHSCYEFFVFIRGAIGLSVEGRVFDVEPFDLFMFPPEHMHSLINRNECVNYERCYIYISEKLLQSMSVNGQSILSVFENATRSRQYRFPLEPKAFFQCRRWMHAIKERDDTQDLCAQLDNYGDLCRLFAGFARAVRQNRYNAEEPDTQTLASSVIRYLNAHYTEPLTLDDVSRQVGFSKYHMLRTFKESTRTTILEYIITKRVLYAKSLILSGAAPSEACFRSGFGDYSNFLRAFKKTLGATPRELSGKSTANQEPRTAGSRK